MAEDQRVIALLNRSFHQTDALQANEEIYRIREQIIQEKGTAFSYELLLTGRDWEYLQQQIMPRVKYHLGCKKINSQHNKGAFFPIFYGKQLYFLHAHDFLDQYCQTEGLSLEELDEELAQACS